MKQVVVASRLLLDDLQLASDAREVLETGIIVTYWRPFSKSNAVGSVGTEWLPDTPRAARVHKRMGQLRNKVAAHTDLTSDRTELDWSNDDETEQGTIYIRTAIDGLLPDLVGIAEELTVAFTRESRRLREETPRPRG